MSGSKVPLACAWHEERFYTAGPVLRNGAGFLADGKPWVSMPLIRYGFTIPTHPCIRIFYKRTFDATNQLATGIICTKAQSASWLITSVCIALQQSSARPSWSVI